MKKLTKISLLFVSIFWVSILYAQGIPPEARSHFNRGLSIARSASSKIDYQNALKEFKKAKELAPNWPDVYFNLGLVNEKLGYYGEAIKSFKVYIKLSPQAEDARQIKDKIYELEYIQERKAKEERFPDYLAGSWKGGGHYSIREIVFYVNGDNVRAGVYTTVQAISPRFGPEGMRSYAWDFKRIPVEVNGKEISFRYNLTFDYSSNPHLGRALGKTKVPMYFHLKAVSSDRLSGTLVWGDRPPREVKYKKVKK